MKRFGGMATYLGAITLIVLIGGIALFWRRFERPAHTLKLAALYWHFIDVIWVFLFPLQKTFGHVDAAALDEFQGLRR